MKTLTDFQLKRNPRDNNCQAFLFAHALLLESLLVQAGCFDRTSRSTAAAWPWSVYNLPNSCLQPPLQ